MAFRYHKYKAIVSIDFGTAYSGSCYTVTTHLTAREFRDTKSYDITQITSWPGNSFNENKTPSINIYDKNHRLLHWGGAARNYIEEGKLKTDQIVKEKFKLDLSSSTLQKRAIDGKEKENDVLRSIIDYFREIFDHTMITVQKNIGFTNEKVEKEDIRFVIIMPVQWSDTERAIMRTVAKEAGLITEDDHEDRLLIINESFAAALHCEQNIIGFDDMKPGDKYIICDAGGGTVDLATFESIERVDNDPVGSFRRCQLTADSGDTCGSTFVDENFRKLLTSIFYDGKPPKNEEENKQRKKLFSPAIKKFIQEVKPVFGQRSNTFKFPKCKHANALANFRGHLFIESSDEGDKNDGQCLVCKVEDFRHLIKKDFGEPTTLKLEDANIVPDLDIYKPMGGGVDVKLDCGSCTLTISYDFMRRFVFKNVVESTVKLIDRQIKKTKGNIDRTYLVGGFGGSPYLQKMIKKYCLVKETEFPDTKFETGTLIIDKMGNSAAVRGAMIYGIELGKRALQSDIAKKTFNYNTTDKYKALICLDIGYEGTAFSYKDLENKSDEIIDIIEWPGLKENNFSIPTAKETIQEKTLWSPQVAQLIGLEHKKLIVPSKYMSVVKTSSRDYLCEYLKLVLGHVYQIIAKDSPHLSDQSKYRYVITMENCYPFFKNKSQMRHIAQIAGIVSKEDPFERLLLISRGNATAMYNEMKYFSDTPRYANHFLQINMYHDIHHLSSYESIKINGADMDAEDDKDTGIFRNVRSMRSTTFDFDFISSIASNLINYILTNVCIKCSGGHDTYNPTYYAELRRGLLSHIKTKLNFKSKDETQNIPITDSGCCIACIKVDHLLDYVFGPAVKHLASEINRFATQNNMAQGFSFDKIFLSGALLETDKANYEFLDSILVRSISDIMTIDSDFIKPSECNGKEALLGAAIYGNQPEAFTERVSRATYAVKVSAFKLKKFSDDEKTAIETEETDFDKYHKRKSFETEETEVVVDKRIKNATFAQLSGQDKIMKTRNYTPMRYSNIHPEVFRKRWEVKEMNEKKTVVEKDETKVIKKKKFVWVPRIQSYFKSFKSHDEEVIKNEKKTVEKDETNAIKNEKKATTGSNFKSPETLKAGLQRIAKFMREFWEPRDLESEFVGFGGLGKPVDLFYHESRDNLSLNNLERQPETPTFFIHRGDKILEKDQIEGISKKFCAYEDCIVYATIYSSDSADSNREETSLDDTFRKIHQFEIYLKRERNYPTIPTGTDNPLYFNIRYFPNNNEVEFNAEGNDVSLAKIPVFRFRDEFLVANIYDDLPFTDVGDLTIKEKTEGAEAEEEEAEEEEEEAEAEEEEEEEEEEEAAAEEEDTASS